MRHLSPIALVCLLLSACGGGENPSKTQSAEPVNAVSKGPDAGADGAPAEPAEVDPATVPGGKEFVTRPKEKRPTPLHRVVQEDNPELVLSLIQDGADVNAAIDNGITPLHIATGEGHLEVVRVLLEHGADPNVQQVRGGTPLHIAVQEGHLEIIKLLLEKGADPNIADKTGVRPLHTLCLKNKIAEEQLTDVAEWLLDAGAEIDAVSEDGSTALQAACDYEHPELVALLLAKGANTEVHGYLGRTPLHTAAIRQNKAICELLLANGADVNAKNDDQATPFAIAAYLENAELVELFQSHGGS